MLMLQGLVKHIKVLLEECNIVLGLKLILETFFSNQSHTQNIAKQMRR